MAHENSGEWSLPGGWVDEDQSVRSNAVKEVKEETGLDVRAERLIAVQDCANHNALTYPYGVLKFFVLCRRVDGRFTPNMETTEIRYFEEGRLPRLSEHEKHRGANRHVLRGPSRPRLGDAVRVNPITVRGYCRAET